MMIKHDARMMMTRYRSIDDTKNEKDHQCHLRRHNHARLIDNNFFFFFCYIYFISSMAKRIKKKQNNEKNNIKLDENLQVVASCQQLSIVV